MEATSKRRVAEPRTVRVPVLLKPTEARRLDKLRAALGMNRAEYMRHKTLYQD